MSKFMLIGFGLLVLAVLGFGQVNQPQPSDSRVSYLRSLTDEARKEYEDLRADWDKQRQEDGKAFASLQAKLVVQAQMILGRFGYGTRFTGTLDQQTQVALRNFQAAKGIPVSGGIDALTYYALTNDDELADEHFVDFGSYSFYWHDTYASLGGAWDRLNTSETYVVSSEIECDKPRKACSETQAVMARVLRLDTITAKRIEYEVTKWDDYEVIAEDTSPDCERDELRINRQEKSVLLLSTPTYKYDFCKQTLGKPETVTYKLVDGTKIFSAREEAASKRKLPLYRLTPVAKAIIEAKN